MTVQLSLPTGWARNFTVLPAAHGQLDDLRRDRLEVKVEIRAVLDRFAQRHGIGQREVARSMGAVDDLMSDLSYDVERELELPVEAEEPSP